MRKLVILLTLLCSYCIVTANTLRGIVTDENNQPLPYATVMVKGTTSGTTANARGQYQLELNPGTYTIVCQYIGYKKTEQQIKLTEAVQTFDFKLPAVSMQIKEVVIKSNGEDPAYAIIREAIKKRKTYQQQVKEFQCMIYSKGTLQALKMPDKILGKKTDKQDMGLDSAGSGVLYLTESVSNIAWRQPDKLKVTVVSSRKSGGGFGINFPAFINFYDNNVEAIITEMGPRGFISPIAENALSFYKYKLEGSFIEDGNSVYKITVTPKRKYEPLFTGTIFITDHDWRIHSLDLTLTPEYTLEMLDLLRIRQTHVPVSATVWRVKDQVVHLEFAKLGMSIAGNFVDVYSDYNLQPNFGPKYFDNVILKLSRKYNQHSKNYWDSIRPVPLEPYEMRDYKTKDSTAKANKDSAFSRYRIDSLRKKQGPVKPLQLLWSGISRKDYFTRDSQIVYNTFRMKGLAQSLKYNTVEGLVLAVEPSFTFDAGEDRALTVTPYFRYGTSNTHFNSYVNVNYATRGKLFNSKGTNSFLLAGGKQVSQFNHDNPIDNLMNEFYTLLLHENFMKIYENWFLKGAYLRNFDNKTSFRLSATYENRIPLENTTDFSFFGRNKTFTPNHPYELANVPFDRHSAVVLEASFKFQPGQKFWEFPDRTIAYGSKYPTFEIGYGKGIPGIANSVADFDKWNFNIRDNMNFKLFGEFRYNLGVGGFLNAKDVEIPDYRHFNGNQTFYNIKYLNSFQLAPYYLYSTTAAFYATANVEHHFNGLLTNKIPLFNRLKWNLVVGSNAFYVNSDNNYVEVFAGLENILKVARVDVIAGYQSKDNTRIGVRVGFGGLLGNLIMPKNN
ncbi:DUF5686 and carboxypeptidase regulatory-like domain-containing protein [Chitinophaga sp. Cy-1792]|uniref:DUF5686 and carboxypeptidase regulatory-like domain-containing protein n=1 Tax=Chitinophaga sp. Cy-1792 TaxID=2608339 RepID=UPI001420B0BC|nr:DUF5686 and carboxypeptidase regulatory-like domain-containing protein [Chitinophaga sp. Cy-1792]